MTTLEKFNRLDIYAQKRILNAFDYESVERMLNEICFEELNVLVTLINNKGVNLLPFYLNKSGLTVSSLSARTGLEEDTILKALNSYDNNFMEEKKLISDCMGLDDHTYQMYDLSNMDDRE